MNDCIPTGLCRSFVVCVLALSLSACGEADLATVEPAVLSMDPTSVTFTLPVEGERTSDVRVEVRNTGGSALILGPAVLDEDDDSPEVAIVDGDDWTRGGLQIAPGSSLALVLRWTVLNAQIDTGRVTLPSNGGEVSVSFTTLDIDPQISVATTPAGDATEQGTTVSLDDALPGGAQKLVATLTSGSVAALEVESICLVDPEGACLDNASSAPYRLCRGEPASPVACDPVEVPDLLAQGATHTITAFFTPDRESVDTSVGTILIRSNAANSPTYSIELSGTPCIRRNDGDVCGTCGDSETDNGEDCDDGNVDEDDGCRNDCSEALCGDGLVQQGVEACDDGNDIDTDDCKNDCTEAECGDGVVQEGVEVCDDGNEVDTDACRNDCTLAECGDGVVREGVEACDDGNDDETDACRNDCTEAFCGDGVVQEGVEACDDGNLDDTDGCLNNCAEATCGDGVVQEGVEACDDENRDNNDACLNDCRIAECGDGVVRADFEACDDGNRDNTDACLNNCREAFCGDGVVQTDVEQCDDGDLDDTDACLNNCLDARCGDGVIHEGAEQCDDENRDNNDACLNDCRIAECGDGVVREGFEACDDGNRINEDACRNDCTEAFCGDGIVFEDEEACDDGNRDEDDACLNDCTEAGCGDGVVQEGEEVCDDGNEVDTDACRNDCTEAFCGDGVVFEDEEACDDGNEVETDACLSTCVEAFCGDGVVQEGVEDCDDGGNEGGDACNPDCTDNRAPSQPTVRVERSDPLGGEALTCVLVAPGVDPDGDAVQHNFTWFVDNAPAGIDVATVPAGRTVSGEVWRCRATPTDGLLDGPFGEASVTVRVCRGEEVVCVGGDVRTCNGAGDGFDLLEDCQDNGCSEGACLLGGPCSLAWDRNQAGPGIVFLNDDFTVMSDRSWQAVRAPLARSSGKWYFEVEADVGPNGFNFIGVGRSASVLDGCCTGNTDGWGYYGSAGNLRGLGTNHPQGGAQWRGGTFIIGVAVDLDQDRIWWSLDGVWQLGGNPATNSIPAFTNVSGTVSPQTSVALANSFSTLHACGASLRFGPPTGFQAWDSR